MKLSYQRARARISWRNSVGECLYLVGGEALTDPFLYRELPLFKGLSFTTISSTGPNAGALYVSNFRHVLSNLG